MLELTMMAPAALGFALGAPTGALLLGAMRWVGTGRRHSRSPDGSGGAAPALGVPAAVVSQPMPGPSTTDPSQIGVRRATRPRTAQEHALALARFVLEPIPGGLRGKTIPSNELQAVYREMAAVELGVEPWPWQPVATELMRILSIRKAYKNIGGQRTRVYCIPDCTLEQIIADAAARGRRTEAARRRTAAVTAGAAAMAA